MQLERVRVERLFGSGIYLAENEDVARNYREELARVRGGYKADGQQLTDDAAAWLTGFLVTQRKQRHPLTV